MFLPSRIHAITTQTVDHRLSHVIGVGLRPIGRSTLERVEQSVRCADVQSLAHVRTTARQLTDTPTHFGALARPDALHTGGMTEAADRPAPPPEIYMSFMQELDTRRRKLKWPAWKLDDMSGVNDGYSQKALHADAPSGRQAGWLMISYMASALYPKVRVKLIACKRMPSRPSINSRTTREIARSKIVPEQNVRRYLSERARVLGKKGARARNGKLSARQRSRLARHAARTRWSAVKAAKQKRPPTR